MLGQKRTERLAAARPGCSVVARRDAAGLSKRLSALYLESAPPLVRTAKAALERGDHDQAMRAFHSLKSSSAAIGLTTLADLCARLELAAMRDDAEQCACDLPLFLQTYTAAVDQLTRHTEPTDEPAYQ